MLNGLVLGKPGIIMLLGKTRSSSELIIELIHVIAIVCWKSGRTGRDSFGHKPRLIAVWSRPGLVLYVCEPILQRDVCRIEHASQNHVGISRLDVYRPPGYLQRPLIRQSVKITIDCGAGMVFGMLWACHLYRSPLN